MSTALIEKLEGLLSTGRLLQMVDESQTLVSLMHEVGYKKNDYTKFVKQFLIDNDIDFSHFWVTGKPPAIRKTVACLTCSKGFSFVSKPSRKDQEFCSKSCALSYTRKGHNHPNFSSGKSCYRDTAFNQYGTSCTRCGFNNEYAIIVHHIDRDRTNNNVDNLEVLCANCHYIEHKGSFINH